MVEPITLTIETGQQCLKNTPMIVLGSGASVPHGLPTMGILANALKASCPPQPMDDSSIEDWNDFVETLETHNLEDALSGAEVDDDLHDHIVRTTWACINQADHKAFNDVVLPTGSLPLTRLFRYLFNSTARTISVVTTNYDRLAEYAADCANYRYFTGFSGGYMQHRQEPMPNRRTLGGQAPRTVEIWKVHGSLDWFVGEDNREIAIPLCKSIPEGFRPAIVTPGIAKYERTHQEPFRSTITEADRALSRAKAFLCVGFGFNDQHIQPNLMRSWQQNDALLVVLAKELTDSVKTLLQNANGREFLALEEAPNLSTKMWSHLHPEGVVLESPNLWQLSAFLQRTTGR